MSTYSIFKRCSQNFTLKLNESYEIIESDNDSNINNNINEKVDKENKNTPKSTPRKFNANWLNQFDWLKYNSTNGLMFCNLCQTHNSNKSNKFTEGTNNFRKSTLTEHAISDVHKASIEKRELSIRTKEILETAIAQKEKYYAYLK